MYGCFHATKAELSGCNRNRMAHKAEGVYYLLLYEKSVLSRIHIHIYTKANVVTSQIPLFL